MNIGKKLLLGLLALGVLFPLALTSTTASAQQSSSSQMAPKIDGFDVEPATGLSAGNELVFTLYGSPGGTATVRIEGAVDKFPLEEEEAGVYEGTYTIRNRDRIKADSMATANLRLGNRIATEILDESLLVGAASRSEIKRAADAAALVAVPKIDRFEVDPADRLDAGAVLFFSISANPGAKVSVRINGMKGKIALQEVARGVYEGSYTINSRDRIAANSTTTATVRVGEREASYTLGQPLLAATGRAPSALRGAINCANCAVVEAINLIEVNGDGSYLGKIAGGVVGAVIGGQVGQGRGTTVAQIAGALGGAVAGNEIEKRVRKTRHYEVIARLQGGGTQTISYATEPPFRVGDKVRLVNGTLVPQS
nr:glycine zipper 2TM domain-containing protein [Rhodoferax sp.]